MDPKNLLIFRIGHLGDTVVALPAIWAVREAFPNARLTVLTNFDARNPHYVSPRAVLPENGLIDDWIAYPSNTRGFSAAMAFFRLSRELRRGRFDAVVYLAPRIRTVQQIDRDKKFFRAAGITRMIGADYLYKNNLTVDIPNRAAAVESEADFLLKCVSSEGIPGSAGKVDMLLTDSEIGRAREWLGQTTHDGQRIVAVAPDSKMPSKVWPEERYADVVARLIANLNCYPVIVGGPEDRPKGERLISKWQTGANAAGLLSIRESAAFLRECDLYLGNDTGNMHLAGAVGTPCVAIFAGFDWRGRWVPFGERNTIFRSSVTCDGCHLADCVNNNRCLDAVEADEVFDACARTLEGK